MEQTSPYYQFPEGLPAFEQHSSFRIVRDPAFDPLLFLESGSDAGLQFICIQVRFLEPAYTYELDAAASAILGVEAGRYTASDERFGCLAILSLPNDAPATANLLAPVVVHFAHGVGLQAVQPGGAWSHAHPIQGLLEGQCS